MILLLIHFFEGILLLIHAKAIHNLIQFFASERWVLRVASLSATSYDRKAKLYKDNNMASVRWNIALF